MPYEQLHYSVTMEAIQIQSNWGKMVHAPFKKVVKFNLIYMGIGVVMGMGIGSS
jgi:hypothetical protein